MGEKIFLLDRDKQLKPLEESPYDSEELLQELLAAHPDLLAAEGDGQWLLVEREHAVPSEEGGTDRWSLDHLFLDSDGVPTLVEVKRSCDTRLRREVVGQMLDYAANGVAWWPIEKIQAAFERRCEEEGIDAASEIEKVIGADESPDRLWQQVKTNLQAGRIRMVFVADLIPPELRRIVEFLNEQMDPAEVIAVEVRQFVGDGFQTLIPRVIGRTGEAERRKGTGNTRGPLSDSELLSQISESTEKQAVKHLLDLVRSLDGIVFMGSRGVSFRVKLAGRKTPISIGWYFPPETVGWYSIRHLVLGYERAASEPLPPQMQAALKSYVDRVAEISGGKEYPRPGIHGCQFATQLIPDRIDAFEREIRRVGQELSDVRS